MTGIIVYTTSACPKCKKLKSYLKSAAIEYTEADMSTPAALTELRANGVFTMMAPVLQVRDMDSPRVCIKYTCIPAKSCTAG